MNLPILKSLKSPSNNIILLGIALLLFGTQYYLMANLPGSRNLQCVPGINLTPLNIIFSIILSLLTGLMVVAFRELYRSRQMNIVAGGASGLGVILGTMTVFCSACALPVISLFGISLSLLFFTDHEIALKGVSIFLMLLGLWLLNSQLNKQCKICKI